jgi:hypothetical protein
MLTKQLGPEPLVRRAGRRHLPGTTGRPLDETVLLLKDAQVGAADLRFTARFALSSSPATTRRFGASGGNIVDIE